jgi:hypothetical protein
VFAFRPLARATAHTSDRTTAPRAESTHP